MGFSNVFFFVIMGGFGGGSEREVGEGLGKGWGWVGGGLGRGLGRG